ncbi:cytochrome P450, partial [Kickxella alabastrina]|uniref:cytochrome P450 n=1 Tax=Kickxella alabastrina TaxID=61397 RepID=UPI002221023C
MTSGQVATETINGLMAGSDTSSSTLAWTIHFFLLHPHTYSRVIKEVRSQFDRDHMITFNESREHFPFLQACIYETLRLVPATNELPRRMPPGGAVFQGHYIPEGYTCLVSLSTANRLPSIWERPEEFYPERFMENEENWRQMLSFSSGVRACPGKNLAWMQVLPTLANIINKYDLKLPADALFTPDHVDKLGNPIFMPAMVTAMTAPKYPERDCVAMISKR